MKKILFIVTSLNSGGIENYLLRFLTHYNGDFIPFIACRNGISGELYEEYLNIKKIEFYDGEIHYFNILLFYKFYKFLNENKFDAICDFTGNFSGIPLFLAKFVNIEKRVAFYRGSTNHFYNNILNNSFDSFMKYMVLKNATNILTNSNAALENFFGNVYKEDKRIEVIYNGINAKNFLSDVSDLRSDLNIAKNKFVVAHVGRYDESKNHKTIIEVAKRLVEFDDDYVVLLCGKNVDNALKEDIKKLGYENKIKVIGYTNTVIKVLNTANCFYFPSITEGQPNALIEALVKGLPFVASNIKPIADIIPIEYHAQLLNPLNVDGAVKLINDIKESYELVDKLNLSEWAIKNFDADRLFYQFKSKLY